jgi:hypothetical protein
MQPPTIEGLRFVRLAQFVVGLRHGAPPVFGHQVVVRSKSPQTLFAQRYPGGEKLPVLQARIPQLAFQILNPVKQ